MDTFTYIGGPRAPGSEVPNEAGIPRRTFLLEAANYDPALHELVSWDTYAGTVLVKIKR